MDSPKGALDRFLARLDTYDPSHDAVASLKGDFADLVASGYFLTWVNENLSRLVAKPDEAGLWFLPQFNVKRAKGLSLSIAVVTATPTIVTSSEAALISPIGRQDLKCDLYRIPPYANEIFDPELQLSHAGSISISRGEVFEIRTDQVQDFRAAEGLAPAVAAVLSGPIVSRFKWSFDRSTLRALASADADSADMQLRAASDLLGHVGDPSSLDLLQSLAEHANHAVRWNAIQNMVRIDPAAARDWLIRATSDPHPHIKAAAKKTLQKLTQN
jgi:hypothetical protein